MQNILTSSQVPLLKKWGHGTGGFRKVKKLILNRPPPILRCTRQNEKKGNDMGVKKANKKSVGTNTEKGKELAMRAAIQGLLHPPAHMNITAKQIPYWKAVMSTRARQLWTETDLELAVSLVRWKAQLDEVETKLEKDGLFLKNKNGTIIENPAQRTVERLSRRIMAMSRMLQLQALAVVGDPRNGKKKLQSENEARDVIKRLDSDLIPFKRQNHYV